VRNTRITKKPFPQFCQILKINCVIEAFEKAPRCEGFKICDCNDRFIGVVMLDPKYDGRAVIRFCNELKSAYGVWHLIQKECSFSYIEQSLLREKVLRLEVK